MSGKYRVRNMARVELDIAAEWAAKEGWNPGLHDADCFWAQDPTGFFVGELDDEVVGTVSAVKYSDSYGFGGFFIVKPEYRKRGYGLELIQKAFESLGDRNIGGDGVVANLEWYKSFGLQLAHYNARYGGKGGGSMKVEPGVVSLAEVPFEKLADYDSEVFGFKRHDFLKLWISRSGTKAFGAVRGGLLKGYGVVRKCFKGYKIGPLFADDPETAQSLFDTLVGQVARDQEVFFDVPECNQAAVDMAKSFRMTKVFATGRIYSKGQPKFPLTKWYGVTSFELG